jgi:hypothetical protein
VFPLPPLTDAQRDIIKQRRSFGDIVGIVLHVLNA